MEKIVIGFLVVCVALVLVNLWLRDSNDQKLKEIEDSFKRRK